MDFVTVKLSGRAGNQLFQHSVGIAYAFKHGLEYIADNKKSTPYEQNFFEGLFKEISTEKIENEYNEKREQFYDEIPPLNNVRLNGYFQSYKYFWEYRDKIFPLFRIKPVIKKDTIGIHVRLGDFKDLTFKHTLISAEYIQQAIHYYTKLGYKSFMVFTDEVPACIELFKKSGINYSSFAFSNKQTPLEDMAALAGCAHQICSASTFSYWGYFLNPNTDKTCIMPAELWGSTHKHLQSEDVYPPGSIKMSQSGQIIQSGLSFCKDKFEFSNTLKLYVNLDHRADRNEKMVQTLKDANIEAERVRGSLPSEFDLSLPKLQVMKNRTPGAIGCHYAQVSCMERADKEGKDVLVMEDDLVFCKDFDKRIKIIEGFLSNVEWDVFFLGATFHINPTWHSTPHPAEMTDCNCTLNKDFELTDNYNIVRTYGMWGTYAYIVNRKSISKILGLFDEHLSKSMGIDWLFMRLSPQLKCFCFVPGCVKQYDNKSDIGDGITKFSEFEKLGRHWYADTMEEFDRKALLPNDIVHARAVQDVYERIKKSNLGLNPDVLEFYKRANLSPADLRKELITKYRVDIANFLK